MSFSVSISKEGKDRGSPMDKTPWQNSDTCCLINVVIGRSEGILMFWDHGIDE